MTTRESSKRRSAKRLNPWERPAEVQAAEIRAMLERDAAWLSADFTPAAEKAAKEGK